MPELPEVETIRAQIQKILPFKIKSLTTSNVANSIIKNKEFSPLNKTISSIHRKGKLLHFHLDQKHIILSSLGMSGSWRISKKPINEKHTHLQLKGVSLKKEPIFLGYIDPRRFGKMHFLNKEKAALYLNKLGTDVSSPQFCPEEIYLFCRQFPQRQIKTFLLEQKYLCGIGNYIASEICALAGIRPTRRLKSLSKKNCHDLYLSTQKVLSGQIANQGLTFSGGYQDAFGNPGQGLDNLVVFHQKVCGICLKTPVKKIVMAQRGTFYCPLCQK